MTRSLIFPIGAELSSLEKALDTAAKRVIAFGDRCSRLGTDLTAAVTAPIAAFGTAALVAAQQYGDAMATIQRLTGASDVAVQQFGESARRLRSEFPISMEEAALAVGMVAREFQLTGQAAEDLARQEIRLARASGSDLATTIKTTDDLLSRWGVSSDQAAGWLEYLSKVSIASGENVLSLAQTVTANAGTFEAWGVPLDKAINLVAGLGASGASADRILSSLNQGLKSYAGDLGDSAKSVSKWAAEQRDSSRSIRDASEGVQLAQRRLKEAMAGSGSQTQEQATAQARYAQALQASQSAHSRLAEAQRLYASVPSMTPVASERAQLYAQALQRVRAASSDAAQADSALAKARSGLSSEMGQSVGKTNAVEAAQRALRDAQEKLSQEQRKGAEASSKLAAAKKPVADMATFLSDLIDKIKRAPDLTKAIQITKEAGIRDAVDLATNVRRGVMDSGKDIAEAASRLTLTLEELERKTRTWADKMKQLWQPVGDALLPVGTRILSILQGLMPLFTRAVEWVGQLTDRFARLPIPVQESYIKMAGLVALIGPALVVFGQLIGGLGGIVRALVGVSSLAGPTLGALWGALTAGLSACWSVVLGAGAALSGFGGWLLWLATPLSTLGSWILWLCGGPVGLFVAATALIVAKWDWVRAWISWGADQIAKGVGAAWSWLTENTRAVWSKIPDAIGYVLSNAGPLLAKATAGLAGILRGVWSGFLAVTKTVWGGIVSFVSGALGGIGTLAAKVLGGLASALGKALAAAGKLFGGSTSGADTDRSLEDILRSTNSVAASLEGTGRELARLVGSPAGAVMSAIDTLSARMAAGAGGATINVSGSGGGDAGLTGALSAVATALSGIPAAVETMVAQITAQSTVIGTMASAVSSIVSSPVAAMDAVVVQIGRVADRLASQTLFLTDMVNTLGSLKMLMEGTVAMPEVPQMAAGGVVTSPTFAMIGEAGPEAVVPLSALGGMGGTSVTVNVAGSVSAEWDIAQRIREELLRVGRLNKTTGIV